jgi:AbiTii-like protein
MKPIDEIIEIATDNKHDIPVLLRKCLVLAYTLKNDRLKEWVDRELNGYSDVEELPEYRKVGTVALGFFVGPFHSTIADQPLNPGVLAAEHRHFATTAYLTQPIAAYDMSRSRSEKKQEFAIPWPPALTTRYQEKFIKDYVLNRAHQKIGSGAFLGLIDTIRNRVLRFALDIREELGEVSEDLTALSPQKVDQYVTNYIFGGTNLIAGTAPNFAQVGSVAITAGDIDGLLLALQSLGMRKSDLAELKTAIADDAGEAEIGVPAVGRRTGAFMKSLAKKLARGTLTVGVDVAKAQATKWILEFLGLSSG